MEIKNIEKCREYSRRYYEENKEKILAKKKIYKQLAKEKHYKWRREYRHKLINRTRLLGRIHYWRREQAKLIQQELKINGYNPYIKDLDDSFSTFGLSDVLIYLGSFIQVFSQNIFIHCSTVILCGGAGAVKRAWLRTKWLSACAGSNPVLRII